MEETFKTMENQKQVEGAIENEKTIAIIAYMTIIGWIIALIMNNDKKDPFASYHIRQMLGICCVAFGIGVISLIPFLGWIIYAVGMILVLVLWISGLLSALNNKQKPVPLFGEKFQDWFKNIL